jgi:hypothetical protein
MPEITCAVFRFKTDEDMELELDKGGFEEIPREKVDPTKIIERTHDDHYRIAPHLFIAMSGKTTGQLPS